MALLINQLEESTKATGVKNLFTGSESTFLTGSESHGLDVRSVKPRPRHRQPESTLETRAQELAKKPPIELLKQLAMEYGMSWSGIAQAIGVSVQAIRKWRHSGSLSIENRITLAKIVATLDILKERIEDPAGWLEIPVLEGYRLRHLDLLAQKYYKHLFDLAFTYVTPQEVLQSINPNWETEMYLEHEVFIAEDGLPAIRRREPHGQA